MDAQAKAREIYVFDSALPDVQTLVSAVGSGHTIIVLNIGIDGLLQLNGALHLT